jgi:hypothetical protein
MAYGGEFKENASYDIWENKQVLKKRNQFLILEKKI